MIGILVTTRTAMIIMINGTDKTVDQDVDRKHGRKRWLRESKFAIIIRKSYAFYEVQWDFWQFEVTDSSRHPPSASRHILWHNANEIHAIFFRFAKASIVTCAASALFTSNCAYVNDSVASNFLKINLFSDTKWLLLLFMFVLYIVDCTESCRCSAVGPQSLTLFFVVVVLFRFLLLLPNTFWACVWCSIRSLQARIHSYRERTCGRVCAKKKTEPKKRQKNTNKTWITAQLKPTHNYDVASYTTMMSECSRVTRTTSMCFVK